MLISTAWRFVHKPDLVVAKIIKVKYYPTASFWTTATYTPKSTFWASILAIINHLEENVTIQFINGDTCIQNQPWCTFWKDLHNRLNLEQTAYQIPNMVFDLWCPNTKIWDKKITTLFGPHSMETLL
jgi:hypothetical protein